MNLFFPLVVLLACFVAIAQAQTNPVATEVGNPVVSTNPVVTIAASTNSTEQIEANYRALLQLDDDSMAAISKLDEKRKAQEGSALPEHSPEDTAKIVRYKIESVRKAYQTFLRENPTHVRAMIAYGSFLNDIDEEKEGIQWWLKAEAMDPKNPAVRNDLANYYSHNGQIPLAMEEYETAIQLQPAEPVYVYNLANMYYLFRKETGEQKHWTEDEVFDHALELFKKARDLEPDNYDYAYAYAESFYGVKTPQWQKAIDGWEYCLKLKITPLQRDQIYTHIARIELRLGHIAKARERLAQVNSEQWQDLRKRLSDIADHLDAASKVTETLHADTPREK